MFAPSRRRRGPGRGISSLTDVPTDPCVKVLHLCRYPDRCCTVCGRHRQRCRHQPRNPAARQDPRV